MSVKPLQWRTVINGELKRAEGHYPGWEYILSKIDDGQWTAVFHDLDPFGENPTSHVLARRIGYTEARRAAIDHHNRPGY